MSEVPARRQSQAWRYRHGNWPTTIVLDFYQDIPGTGRVWFGFRVDNGTDYRVLDNLLIRDWELVDEHAPWPDRPKHRFPWTYK